MYLKTLTFLLSFLACFQFQAQSIFGKVLDKKTELEAEETNKENLKTSAKAKLVAGEPLTEEEASTIVL